jgi:pimeloyl-ACP methyl ester carboxylesterase
VCLLNGLAMSTKSWLGFLPELMPTYDVLLFDYLGQGASDDADDLYTRYLYEKIFGEAFVSRVGEKFESMRNNFCDRYRDRIEALVRLTEAQDPFFAGLEANKPLYAAIPCPVLLLAGAEDRAIPPSQQRKITGVIPHARYEEIEGAGHVVYLERPDLFWPRVRRFLAARDPAA